MQTNLAHSPPLAQSRGLPKRFRLWSLLGLQAIIFMAVTQPLFHKILVNAGESDAKGAVRLIARELAALPGALPDNLALWMQDQPTLRHRLGDARIFESHLEYHGYTITWKPNQQTPAGDTQGRGTLWAIPLVPGKTGSTHFHIQVR